MRKIKDLFGNFTERCRKRQEDYDNRRIREMYQICEYDGAVWLTFEGRLVCPTSFFAETDPVAVVAAIRETYKEHRKQNE